jgi:hypothetical protein
MGLCFYYFDKKLENAAWYYFSGQNILREYEFLG